MRPYREATTNENVVRASSVPCFSARAMPSLQQMKPNTNQNAPLVSCRPFQTYHHSIRRFHSRYKTLFLQCVRQWTPYAKSSTNRILCPCTIRWQPVNQTRLTKVVDRHETDADTFERCKLLYYRDHRDINSLQWAYVPERLCAQPKVFMRTVITLSHALLASDTASRQKEEKHPLEAQTKPQCIITTIFWEVAPPPQIQYYHTIPALLL